MYWLINNLHLWNKFVNSYSLCAKLMQLFPRTKNRIKYERTWCIAISQKGVEKIWTSLHNNFWLIVQPQLGLQRHGMFLEWWNTTKSLSTIWRFSCLLDEGIAEICKKLKSHGATCKIGSSPSGNNFLPCLGLPPKSHRES